jgi:hypothetical protein
MEFDGAGRMLYAFTRFVVVFILAVVIIWRGARLEGCFIFQKALLP